MPEIRKLIGKEYEDGLRKRVFEAIRRLGGFQRDSKRFLAGSQDIIISIFEINGHIIHLEEETYIGMTLIGDASIIDHIHRTL